MNGPGRGDEHNYVMETLFDHLCDLTSNIKDEEYKGRKGQQGRLNRWPDGSRSSKGKKPCGNYAARSSRPSAGLQPVPWDKRIGSQAQTATADGAGSENRMKIIEPVGGCALHTLTPSSLDGWDRRPSDIT